MKKIALITGTSSGLGLETAIILAKNGYTVYATMRSLAKKEPLLARAQEEHIQLKVLALDVTEQQSVDNCVQTIIAAEGQIDLLVNNAGSGFAKTTEQTTEIEMQWVTDVNYFGVVRCSKAVIPGMRTRKKGHIINISSVGGLVGQPFNELYCGAKFAVEGYTEALASYLTDAFHIQFTLVEPGGIVTDFMQSAMEKTMTAGKMAHQAYMPILKKYMSGIKQRTEGSSQQVYQTPLEVAKVILAVAQNENPPLRIRTSEWAEEFCSLKTQADPDGTKSVERIKERFLS
ncbi:SDR family oxidoreductase [Aggregatimonas sangjinii]|uniref:SDR family oxidoreductase n=1 Tax=Aggregatimonas sangjinii TaxID=2583587 RepID=A0A5B7SUE4_9FLAO|nr:SDR family oxidoreductase [Aggregatimonas sangjinii]QCX00480.1 SDR family oxidoreductase [Aggregatimonas sangjinii]